MERCQKTSLFEDPKNFRHEAQWLKIPPGSGIFKVPFLIKFNQWTTTKIDDTAKTIFKDR